MQTIARETTRRREVGSLSRSSNFQNISKVADKWRWRHVATKLLLYQGQEQEMCSRKIQKLTKFNSRKVANSQLHRQAMPQILISAPESESRQLWSTPTPTPLPWMCPCLKSLLQPVVDGFSCVVSDRYELTGGLYGLFICWWCCIQVSRWVQRRRRRWYYTRLVTVARLGHV